LADDRKTDCHRVDVVRPRFGRLPFVVRTPLPVPDDRSAAGLLRAAAMHALRAGQLCAAAVYPVRARRVFRAAAVECAGAARQPAMTIVHVKTF
jgi:hypothetical protein